MSYKNGYNPYRWCVVHECKNTSVKTPGKLWIRVPNDLCMRRRTWLELARRDPNSLSKTSTLYFCEDHFDVENVTENYLQYKMGFVKRIRMKPNCTPSRFDCQADRKHNLTSISDFLTLSNKHNDKAVQVVPSLDHKAIQVCHMTHYRSKNVQISVKKKNSMTSPFKASVCTAKSPFKMSKGIMSKPCKSFLSTVKSKLDFVRKVYESDELYALSLAGSTVEYSSSPYIIISKSGSDASLQEIKNVERLNLLDVESNMDPIEVKQEPQPDECEPADSDLALLYEDHLIKEEMVIGPTVLHQLLLQLQTHHTGEPELFDIEADIQRMRDERTT